MKRVEVLHYDVFTMTPRKGNPAGVVLNGDALSAAQMQSIAAQTGFTETTFVCHLNRPVPRLRYFSPEAEMNLCGHGTIAAWTALQEREPSVELGQVIETKVGHLTIETVRTRKGTQVRMRQEKAQFLPFDGDLAPVLESIGLQHQHLDERFPVMYGSTGNWTLLIPIKRLEDFLGMRPHNKRFASVLTQIPEASIHPICLETYMPEADMHGRHFSATQSGTQEDPVTGTASGVMGAYHVTYIDPLFDGKRTIYIEQGQEIGRDGLVEVTANRQNQDWEVMITGTCVKTGSLILNI